MGTLNCDSSMAFLLGPPFWAFQTAHALNVKVGDYSGAQVIASHPLEPLPSFATGETKQPLKRHFFAGTLGGIWTLSS